jgi:hypothetical protein
VQSTPGANNRTLSSDGLTVRVNFPGGSLNNVVRAYSQIGAVVSKASPTPSQLRSAARPGSAGFTDDPDLQAVTLGSDGSTIDYQFDQVINTINNPNGFLVGTSSRIIPVFAPGGAATILGGPGVGNTVRVTCGNLCSAFLHETEVSGGVLTGTVTGSDLNTAGGLPAGGNAGAFATGFTVAPEALTVSFDNATSVANVLFDQRFATADPSRFKLIDDQGSQIAAAAISVSGGGAPAAGRVTAQVTFPAGTLAGARSLLIQEGGVVTAGGLNGTNVPQVISPTAAAAKSAKKFRKAKAITRKQRAAIRRSVKRH